MTGNAGSGRIPEQPAGDLSMRWTVTALLLAALTLASGAALPTIAAAADGIDVIGPADGGRGAWTGDRMRGARDRLKDILPGRFA